MIVAATGLSGCMASALDVQSTFAPEPSVGLSLAGDDALPQPRPAEDLASADGSVQAPAGSASESPVMALEGAEPTEGAAAIAVDAAATGTAMSDEQATTVALAQPDMQSATTDGTGSRPVDAATARINSATGTQPRAITPPRPPIGAMGKRSGGLLSLFSNNRSSSTRKALIPPAPVAGEPATAELWSAPKNPPPSAPPAVTVASASAAAVPGLPGVDRERALGLNTTETAAPADELEERPVQLASAAGLARLAPNGLIKQHDGVDVACLKPALVPRSQTGRTPLRTQCRDHVGIPEPVAQQEGARRGKLAAHVLFGRRHPDRGRNEMGACFLSTLDVRARRRRHLLLHAIGPYRHRPAARLELALPSPQIASSC